jgi:hypothetical protein
MAHRHFRRAAFVAIGLTAFLSGAALALDYQTDLAPRCPTVELRYLSGPDPCEPHYAVFGITGPTIVTKDSVDVDVTGSIAPRSARHNTPSNAGGKN